MMKKTLTRLLTVALVLSLLVGVMPAALADTPLALTVSATKSTLVLGDAADGSTTVSFTVPEGYTLKDASWNGDAYVGVTGSGASAIVTAKSVGTGTVSVSATLIHDADSAEVSAAGSVAITVNNAGPASVEIAGVPEKLTIGESVQLSVAVLPQGAAQTVVWTTGGAGDTGAATVTQQGLVTGTQTGTVTVTATSTEDKTVSKSVTLTVEAVQYTVELDKTELTLTLNSTKVTDTIQAVVKDAKGQVVIPQPQVTWTSSNPQYVVVYDGAVTGKKATGNTPVTVRASVTMDGKEYYSDAAVTVVENQGAITCADTSVEKGKTITLTPTLKLENNLVAASVTYDYELTTGSSSYVKLTKNSTFFGSNTATIEGLKVGLAQVKITAEYTLLGRNETFTAEPLYVNIRVFGTAAIDVATEAASLTFGSTGVFTEVYYNSIKQSSPNGISLASLFSTTCTNNGLYASSCTFDLASSDSRLSYSGSYSLKNLSITELGSVQFKQNTYSTGNCEATFTIKDANGLTVAEGSLTIRTGVSEDVKYSTDYKTAVTFDEGDFADFWYSVYKNWNLDYVTFSPTTGNWGTLYTTSSKGTKVTSGMKFRPYYTSSTTYYDLDTVTYVPYAAKTELYTDAIPFTAVGTVSGATKEVSGYVVITVNDFTGNITSRGVVFGKGGISDKIIADYKAAKNTSLAYVTFSLPAVEDGRLYYNFAGVLDSVRVSSKDVYYVNPAAGKLDLDLVAFIPGADRTGKVTLYYTGYDADGKNDWSGTITFNVTHKTSSSCFTDITASSYTWAADAADFLYYEGISQGSGGKYSPGANITRGDFMLMLYRAFLEDDYKNFTVTSNFSDVTKGTSAYSQETYQAVGVAKYLGIAQGDGNKFSPKSYITRQEAMALLYRTLDEVDYNLEYKSGKTLYSFTDYTTVSSWAQTAISDLIGHGIVVGSGGKISPKSNISRAEMAVILHRVLTY